MKRLSVLIVPFALSGALVAAGCGERDGYDVRAKEAPAPMAAAAPPLHGPMDVQAELEADPSIDASAVRVETDHANRTLVLTGTVPSAAEKDMAGIVARAKAGGYTVDNQLAIRG